jgi:hypothetical protein
VQVLIGAPTGGAVHGNFYFGLGDPPSAYPLDPKDYSGRIVPGGYEIYLLIRWNVLRPALQDASAPLPPASGQMIALDFALDVKKSNAGSSRDAQLIYASNPVQGTLSPTCYGTPAPVCEDRLWCASTLE